MKLTLAIITLFLADFFSLTAGIERARNLNHSEESLYVNKAYESADRLFAVFDSIQDRQQPASLEIAIAMTTWINTVHDSLGNNNLDLRISTEKVVERRRLRVAERNIERKKDGLEEEEDWFPNLLKSVEVVQEEYRKKGWARPNLGWLTPFRKLAQVLQAEAHAQELDHIEFQRKDESRADFLARLKRGIVLLDTVKAVRVLYAKEGHRPGSIAWVEDILAGKIELMKYIPTGAALESKRTVINRILKEKAPLLKPFRPHSDKVKEAKPTQPTPPAKPEAEKPHGSPKPSAQGMFAELQEGELKVTF